MKHSINNTNQVVIVHLSDIHFGSNHRFRPPVAPSGDRPEEPDFPTLISRLKEDLSDEDPGCPVMICITGDFTQTGSQREFEQVEAFLRELAEIPVYGKPRGIKSIFVVPGNHDVKYDSSGIGERWQQWTDFHRRVFGSNARREEPWSLVEINDCVDELGVVVACLNSSIYVQKGSPDEERGRLDIRQLTTLQDELTSIDRDRLYGAIKIALVHHHPVLIPSLAEPERGYDAIHNSGKLLEILRTYGFHVILHGHKHTPHTFTEDTLPAHAEMPEIPMLVVSGGSVASTKLPVLPRIANSYNRVTVKWHPDGKQSRIRVETRGLQIYKGGTELLPTKWRWYTMRIDDQHFYGFDHLPRPAGWSEREFSSELDGKFEELRINKYARLRGNIPVVQVMPSLEPGQAYDAVLWIEKHHNKAAEDDDGKLSSVTWMAGKKFEVVETDKAPEFAARLTYWGPMLVQARLIFSDGKEEITHVYARMPRSFSPSKQIT